MQDHLNLEQLSELVDDRADEGARAHVEECESCRNALARMREARAFVAEEVTLSPDVLDAAVAAGMAALASTNVVSISSRRRPNPLPWIAGVAAVFVGVLGLAALVNSDFGRDGVDTFATGNADDESAVVAEDAEESGDATRSGGATSGGGSVEGLSGQGAPAPTADSDGRSAAARSPERSFSTEEEVIDYLQRSADSMSTTATACSPEATATLGAPLEQLRSEDVTWQDGPAALWVDPAQRRAVLMRPGGCSLLVDLRY